MSVETKASTKKKELVGVDVFFDSKDRDPSRLAAALEPLCGEDFRLHMITNRGIKVWPDGFPETFCSDHWRGRFMGKGTTATSQQIVSLLGRFAEAKLDFIKTENLCTFDGKPGFSA